MGKKEAGTTNTQSNKFATIKLDVLLNMIRDLPKPPTIYGMSWCKVVPCEIVPPNAIFVSMDLAEWLEEMGVIFFEEPKAAGESNG